VRIAVLVKQVPDTWSDRRIDLKTGFVDRNASPVVVDEICEYALEAALQLRELAGGEIVAVAMGPASASEALRRALEMGADEAVLITDPRLVGADLTLTARVLASVLASQAPDLIVTGSNSTDGRGGTIPAMLAEHLSLPLLNCVDSIELRVGEVSAKREIEGGVQHLRADLPAIVAATERGPEPRVPGLRDVLRARKRKPVVLSLDDLNLDSARALSTVLSADERPPRAAGPRVPFSPEAVREVVDLLVAKRVI